MSDCLFHCKEVHRPRSITPSFPSPLPAPHPLPSFLSEPPTVLTNESTLAFKNESDGKHVELDVRGTWYDRSASVTFGGEPVAHISRSIFNMREIFADKDTVSLSLLFYFFYFFIFLRSTGGRKWEIEMVLAYWGSRVLVFRDCGADGGLDHDCGAVRRVG